jgi:hypothetical protein
MENNMMKIKSFGLITVFLLALGAGAHSSHAQYAYGGGYGETPYSQSLQQLEQQMGQRRQEQQQQQQQYKQQQQQYEQQLYQQEQLAIQQQQLEQLRQLNNPW